MRILIDYRPLQNAYAFRGVGTFCRNIFPRLIQSRLGSSLVFCGYPTETPPEGAVYRTIRRPGFRPWAWEQLCWPFDIWHSGADVFWSSVSLGPVRSIGYPRLCPARGIATVHDLNALRLPAFAAHGRTRSFRIQRRAVARADRVLTVSTFVKNDIVERLGIPAEKISVIPLAVDDAVKEACRTPADEPDHLKAFVLTMGETENKNVDVALRVFEHLADRGFWGDLCVVGSFEKQIPRVRELYSQSRYRERIHFYGDLGTEKLVELYRGCELFLFPSSSEGFGLPVIEAMYCKAPVLTSNATSLPEAGGDAAVYCAPDDVDGFVAQAERVLHDNELRSSLIDKGWKRADAACWDTAIEKLVEVFEETSRRGRNAPGSPA